MTTADQVRPWLKAGAAGEELSEYQYRLLRDNPSFDVAGFDSETKWNTKWNLEESL